MENDGPELNNLARHLARTVETPECDVTALQTRRRCYASDLSDLAVATCDSRQAVDRFAEQVLGSRIGQVRACQKVIHRRQARGRHYASPRDLDGSGFQGEGKVSIGRGHGVAGQINENIDLVGPYSFGNFFSRERQRGEVLLEVALQRLRKVIRPGANRVSEYVELRTVVPFKNGRNQLRERVQTKIARNI